MRTSVGTCLGLRGWRVILKTYLKRFREHGYQLPGAYDTRETRGIPGAINVNGAEHMDMIMQKMKDLDYDKYHKPNPSGKLDVSTNMFIDSIQGIVLKNLDFSPIGAR